ncbi:MAG: LytTR family DNA-binding domain-containing protein [Hespellia sp.]|nr:LytTR family DNA-binding domain-containing protein [Hespellia sp.]
MKIRIAVCEKDPQSREYLAANIKELGLELEIVEFDNAYELEEEIELNTNAYDVVCMSASLQKEGDGIAIAKKIRGLSLKVTIFIIAENKAYYQEAFEMFAMAYLIKPVRYRMLESCFTFYTKNNSTDRRASWMVKSKGGNWKRVFCRDILYIESNNHEYILHMSDGGEIESYGKLVDVVDQISSESLIRCHQSYIVNMFYANEMKTDGFTIGDDVIPISRRYQKEVKEQYYKFMFGRM